MGRPASAGREEASRGDGDRVTTDPARRRQYPVAVRPERPEAVAAPAGSVRQCVRRATAGVGDGPILPHHAEVRRYPPLREERPRAWPSSGEQRQHGETGSGSPTLGAAFFRRQRWQRRWRMQAHEHSELAGFRLSGSQRWGRPGRRCSTNSGPAATAAADSSSPTRLALQLLCLQWRLCVVAAGVACAR